MGSLWSSLCSKPSTLTGGHVVISDTTSGGGGRPLDPRAARAEAAERRSKAADNRGVVKTNPNRGKLSQKLAEQKQGNATEPEIPQRIIYD